MDWLESLDAHWIWLTLGLVLGILEMLVPGVYLLWFAMAALATGLLTWLLDLSPAMQVIDFAFLSLIIVFSARRFLREDAVSNPDTSTLNRRGLQLIGKEAQITRAIEHGSGRVRLGDSEWIAYGPDMGEGAWVRVVGTEGTILKVEPLELLPES